MTTFRLSGRENKDFRKSGWLLLLGFVVVTQAAHVVEHVAQLIQIHGLGIPKPHAHGLLGQFLDQEWIHFAWDMWLLVAGLLLLIPLRANRLLWLFIPITLWHGFEHIFIIRDYLERGIEGSPGLLATGGLIAGGLPLTRPQLHFFYNLVQGSLLVMMFFSRPTALRLRKSQASSGPISVTSRRPSSQGRSRRQRPLPDRS